MGTDFLNTYACGDLVQALTSQAIFVWAFRTSAAQITQLCGQNNNDDWLNQNPRNKAKTKHSV